jgi:hypothetical protein
MAYVLLISEQKLKDSTAINLNVDVNILLPYVLQAQTLYIEPKLGTQLYEHIKVQVMLLTRLYLMTIFLLC